MKIFGFSGHPEVIHNAAPVMSPQPSLYGLDKSELSALKDVQLSGNLDRDMFVRSQPAPVDLNPFMPSERALWQITAMSPAGLRGHIAQKMSSGKHQDLADVVSWLSAAQQHDKIQFAQREDAEVNFGKNLRESKHALEGFDLPLSAISLNRARRQIQDFKDLRPAPEAPALPASNPFVLLY